MGVADISIMEWYEEQRTRFEKFEKKIELRGLDDGLDVVIRGRVCSMEIRFSIKKV